MKIALITPNGQRGIPALNGARGYAPLAEALVGLGHRVTVYDTVTQPDLPDRDSRARQVRVEHMPSRGHDFGADIRALSEDLAHRWHDNRPDVVHAHSWTMGLAALAGARGLGVPVVQTFHSVRSARPARSVSAPQAPPAATPDAQIRVKISLARNVSGVLAASSQTMHDLTDLGVPRAVIRVVPWGVDTGQFAPEGPAAKGNGRPRLLTVTPLTRQHGLDVVIRALAEVPEAELVIAQVAGAAPDSGVEANLRRLCEDLGVAGRVAVIPGARDLPSLLRSADLLVSAAWDEPFGIITVQAMACGIPVVAPAVGCYRDAVIDGTTGVLVPPGQPGALAHRIRLLLASPLRLEAFGIAAADRARARYSWDRIGQETARVYERAMSPAG